ncbi:MAG: hypothetical protein NWF06_03780 [Candidatus Bathyarchaeota archaeon]|nr:hypothetical protein [Candidatus Bathyarchaeum sp.]
MKVRGAERESFRVDASNLTVAELGTPCLRTVVNSVVSSSHRTRALL